MSARVPLIKISKIVRLRKQGWSLPELKREFPEVGYGTIFRHIQNVKISPKYQTIWEAKKSGSASRKKKSEELARQKAKETVNTLVSKERLLFLSAIYWGEGSKGELVLTNSDPELIKVYIKGLVNELGVDKDRIKPSIRIYEDLKKEECLDFWSNITGINKENFLSVNVLEGKKTGKLPFGMCRIRVKKGGDVLKYLKAIRQEAISLF